MALALPISPLASSRSADQRSSGAMAVDQVVSLPLRGRRLSSVLAKRGSNRTSQLAAPHLAASQLPNSQLATSDPFYAAYQSCTLPAFVAGPENRLLARVMHDCLRHTTATDDQPQSASPIVLVGPSGCGKTHLAQGLVSYWETQTGLTVSTRRDASGKANSPSTNNSAIYLTASDFVRAYADALEEGSLVAFRQRLRTCRLLVLEDLHRLRQADYLQEELLHTLDVLEAIGATVVVTSGRLPAETASLSASLVNRLSAGVTVEIAPLQTAARVELLRQATTALGANANQKALETLAEQLTGEPPQLLRAAIELRRRGGLRIGVAEVEQFLHEDRADHSPPLREICRLVAKYYGVTQKMLTSASRKQTVVLARAVAIYLARQMTPLSYQEIGRVLGGRDHTTIMHNARRIETGLVKDRALQSTVDELRRSIESLT